MFNVNSMKQWLLFVLLVTGCNLATAPASPETSPVPQADRICSEIAASALQTVGPNCNDTGINQACYGHERVEAQFQQGIQTTFAAIGDIAQVQSLRLISTSPFNEDQQVWGVALLRAQADLADRLPGESVTFLLYGGATLDNVTASMEGVILSTGFGNTPACAAIPPAAVLIQSPNGTQVTMNLNGANVSIGSTLYLTAISDDRLTIATVNGVAVVEAFGITQSVIPGAQVTLPLGSADGLQVIGPPSPPQPFDQNAIQRAPFSLLPNSVQIPPPIVPPVANTTPTLPSLPITATLPPVTIPLPPTAIPTACVPRTDWIYTYTIEAGDTLSAIARRFGLTLSVLQNGNCIPDANIIAVGQVLRVPTQPLPTATATFTPQPLVTDDLPPAATATPTDPIFQADQTSLQAGECTTIRWVVENIDSVFFQGEPAIGNDRQQVCPTTTTRYTLLVIYRDGSQSPFFLSIEVEKPETTEEITVN